MSESGSGSHRAVILTAIPVEYQAVRAHLTNIGEERHKQGTIYERGTFSYTGQSWDVMIGEIGTGNSTAALEAERAIHYFKPDLILFVGIAGGCKDVKLGDVVAATKVYGYESGKAESVFLPRPNIGRSTYTMEQRARAEAKKPDWLQRLKGALLTPTPTVHVAPVAAGEKVVASTRSHIAKFLQAQYDDALAVEMEGYGFLEAIHANSQVEALVIRGISDLLDGKREADAAKFQQLAAQHASAFAFEIIAKFDVVGAAASPENPRRIDTETEHLNPPLGSTQPPPLNKVPGSRVPPRPPTSTSPHKPRSFLVGLLPVVGVIVVVLCIMATNIIPDTLKRGTSFDNLGTTIAQAPPSFVPQLNHQLTVAAATATIIVQQQLNGIYPDPYPPKWKNVILADNLTQPFYWSSDTNGLCRFAEDGYHVSQPTSQGFAKCISSPSDTSQYTLEVQMAIIKGDCGGVVLHADFTHDNYYLFIVCQNGHYELRHYNEKTYHFLVGGYSSNITSGINRTNTIAIVADDKNFDLYANHQKIGSAYDTSSSPGNQVGLVAFSQHDPTETVYTEAIAWGNPPA